MRVSSTVHGLPPAPTASFHMLHSSQMNLPLPPVDVVVLPDDGSVKLSAAASVCRCCQRVGSGNTQQSSWLNSRSAFPVRK